MALVPAFSTLMLPEALVVESMLQAHGIKAMSTGRELCNLCPHFAIVFGGIWVFVDEADVGAARELIAASVDVPGYKTIESRSFERRPIRNALLTFAMLLMGAPFPFWYRRARGARDTV